MHESRYWYKADISRLSSNVRFRGKADLVQNLTLNPVSLVANPCCNRLVPSRNGVVRTLGEAVRRRDFIKAIASTGATWPLAVYGQQSARPLMGFLHFGSSGPFEYQVAAFNQGLKETGYVDGQNAAIEYRGQRVSMIGFLRWRLT